MKVLLRVDASIQIGIGHVMRCLTLAEALRLRGASCSFICRDHPGNLIDLIKEQGFNVHRLPLDLSWKPLRVDDAYGEWLGAEWEVDAKQTRVVGCETVFDWLVVDHYALDARWERALAQHNQKIMVIDDLADRPHVCDLLLDQTFGRYAFEYHPFVPEACRVLCGSEYALLRPEFAAMRHYSMQRREQPVLHELLISMGGIDKDNVTGQVLRALRSSPLPVDCRITVVMGATAPWLRGVQAQAQNMPWLTRVMVGVGNMAQLMGDSDFAIGAAGATSWERCCLGIPTVILLLAENQRKIAEALTQSGAAYLFPASTLESRSLIVAEHLEPVSLRAMSIAAASITDGLGVKRVAEILMNKA